MIEQPLIFQALCANIEAYLGLVNCPIHRRALFWVICGDCFRVALKIFTLDESIEVNGVILTIGWAVLEAAARRCFWWGWN